MLQTCLVSSYNGKAIIVAVATVECDDRRTVKKETGFIFRLWTQLPILLATSGNEFQRSKS